MYYIGDKGTNKRGQYKIKMIFIFIVERKYLGPVWHDRVKMGLPKFGDLIFIAYFCRN